ncbi:hypothetical protein QAY90_gp07 [Xanthomonas phage Langgrundblatt2]|uniref:Uncharacterized protein n=1 Tax=Xanthomonas phage Langgrundblatt2 TaxID=2939129 RepID=A0A9E7J5I7_9CAUD|nr:hypothetical protein QAY90_gp07 [Xanthomonas phage Langgrundblatt2]URA06838.1 hypothetical protein Langgrundblatt2_BL2007 [Xanthomonas phage Langgrundblatt2]
MIFQVEVFAAGPIYAFTFKLFGIPIYRYSRLNTNDAPKHHSGGLVKG